MQSAIALSVWAAGFLVAMSSLLSWRQMRPMPEGVSGGAPAFLSGKLIYAGGTTWRNQVKQWLAGTLVYDRRTDTWSQGPSLPQALAYGAYLRSPDSLEILGGINAGGISLRCWRLDEGATQWAPSGTVPAATVFGQAVFLNDHAYVFGGCADTELSRCSESVLRRNPSGSWETVSKMPEGPMAIFALSVVRDKVYFFGGCSRSSSGGVRNRNEAFRFDPLTNEWKTLHSLPEAVRGMTAAAVDRRYILLAGGYGDSAAGFSSNSYLYDTENDQYIRTTPLPFAVMGLEMLSHDGVLWALGGEDKPRNRSPRLIEAKLPE